MPSAHELTLSLTDTEAYLTVDTREIVSANLALFFRHSEPLAYFWSERENEHMYDVRTIYDSLAIIALVSVMLLFTIWDTSHIRKASVQNIPLILSLFLLIPIFPFFWSEIFHTLFFTNDLWLMAPDDLSYHIFPLEYFIISLVMISVVAVAINLMIYAATHIFSNSMDRTRPSLDDQNTDLTQ